MAYIYDLTDTWNAGGTTFYGIKMNVTNTASAAGSKLLSLQVGGSEQFGVDKNGNVGVGTSSPGARLVINGGTGTSQTRFEVSTTQVQEVATNAAQSAYADRLADAAKHIWKVTGSERMRIDSSGNVGIGTSSPTFRLTAANSAADGGWLYSTGTVSVLGLGGYSAAGDGAFSLRYDRSTGGITFNGGSRDTPTERMRINSSGDMLVNATSDWTGGYSKLYSYTSAASSRTISAYNAGSSAGASAFLGRVDNTAVDLATFYYGASTVVGTITTNGTNTAYNTSSDARLKHDIVDAPDASDLIDAIQVRSFKWNADNSEQRYGFVAQELLEVAPEAVSVPADEEEMMGVDYAKLVPMLVKEIQSLRARVAQLEGN